MTATSHVDPRCYVALELSQAKWLVGALLPRRAKIILHTVQGGDAAGLAYPESGEGIKPAIESANLAAATLIAATPLSGDALQPYAAAIERLHPPRPQVARRTDRITAALGRALLGSPLFTRHVVIDRWFLRSKPPAVGRA